MGTALSIQSGILYLMLCYHIFNILLEQFVMRTTMVRTVRICAAVTVKQHNLDVTVI